MYTDRKMARLHREILYTSGIPCVRGHLSPRYTNSGVCIECHKQYRMGKEMSDYLKLKKPRSLSNTVRVTVTIPEEDVATLKEFAAALMKGSRINSR